MRDTNGVLEDIAAVIGFGATTRLVAIFGPGNILVPVDAKEDHPMTLAIGLPAMRRLVAEWGGQILTLSLNSDYHHARLLRGVSAMLNIGMPPRDVAGIIGTTERHVRRLRIEAEEMGILPLVLRAKGGRRRDDGSLPVPDLVVIPLPTPARRDCKVVRYIDEKV